MRPKIVFFGTPLFGQIVLQKLIDKYRVPEDFEVYMSKPGKNRDKELEAVRICMITPKEIIGRKYTAKE